MFQPNRALLLADRVMDLVELDRLEVLIVVDNETGTYLRATAERDRTACIRKQGASL